MKGLEILQKYPHSADVVRKWLFNRMVESMQDDSVPEDFKEAMMNEAVTNERLAVFIDTNPRMLFDVFDNNDLFIEIFMYTDVTFTCKIGNETTTNSWKTRKDAEAFAIEAAFEMLENKLKPVSEDEHFDTASGDNGND